MFWLFRRRKPLTPAQLLDAAAGILDVRGKCTARAEDEFGRVDVLGAMRTAVFGVPQPDIQNSWKLRGFAAKWETYGEVKELMVLWLLNNDPQYRGYPVPPTSQSMFLAEWSDANEERMLVELMRRAAREARHMSVVST